MSASIPIFGFVVYTCQSISHIIRTAISNFDSMHCERLFFLEADFPRTTGGVSIFLGPFLQNSISLRHADKIANFAHILCSRSTGTVSTFKTCPARTHIMSFSCINKFAEAQIAADGCLPLELGGTFSESANRSR